MDLLTYSLSKKIAASAVSGVSSMVVKDTTLEITTNEGDVLQMVFPTPADGKDGVSVINIDINEDHELIFIMSDNTQITAGQIEVIKGDKGDTGATGPKGKDGFSPIVETVESDNGHTVNITDIEGVKSFEVLNGKDGIRIDDTTSSTTSTYSSAKINELNAIGRYDVIFPNETKETGLNLAQGESHFYGRLLQLDGHLGSGNLTLSFLLFVKADYDNPTTVYATQLAGMGINGSNIAHTTYFELGVSSSGNLTIKNNNYVTASYRFI